MILVGINVRCGNEGVQIIRQRKIQAHHFTLILNMFGTLRLRLCLVLFSFFIFFPGTLVKYSEAFSDFLLFHCNFLWFHRYWLSAFSLLLFYLAEVFIHAFGQHQVWGKFFRSVKHLDLCTWCLGVLEDVETSLSAAYRGLDDFLICYWFRHNLRFRRLFELLMLLFHSDNIFLSVTFVLLINLNPISFPNLLFLLTFPHLSKLFTITIKIKHLKLGRDELIPSTADVVNDPLALN